MCDGVDGEVLGGGRPGSDNPLPADRGADEMHLSKKEKLRFTQRRLILLSFLFSQNKRRQPNQGNRHMQIVAINFS